MRDKLTSLSHCALGANKPWSVAVYQEQLKDSTQFHDDVKQQYAVLSTLNAENIALFDEQAYPFCVSLFALLHLKKKVWIPGNNKLATVDRLVKQGCVLIGDWQGKQENFTDHENGSEELELQALDLNTAQIRIFTSGSNGDAKTIIKSLQQLQNEIDILEKNWGKQLAQSHIFGTVSHQHIYGLIFRILWPLAARRCFHSSLYLSPEPMLKAIAEKLASWVASPAQLKRLDEHSAWDQLKSLNAIFSSGGDLVEAVANQIYSQCQQKVIEIYGSSETGGIAWRRQMDNPLWTTFDGINISQNQQGQQILSSPYLAKNTTVILDDKLEHSSNGQFTLCGRVDRIVKIEEKRLSLDELESFITHSDWVEQAYCLLFVGKRDKIAATLVLTETGRNELQKLGRSQWVSTLRKQLMTQLETVVLPRKWLFINAIPLTAQSKIDKELLEQLLSLAQDRFPQIQNCDLLGNTIELQLKINEGLSYFNGHFPDQPILPGVTQLAWVEEFGHLFFNIDLPFVRMEAVKFKKIIRPDSVIQMKLNWKNDTHKLYFELRSAEDSHSSGCMVYGNQP